MNKENSIEMSEKSSKKSDVYKIAKELVVFIKQTETKEKIKKGR